MNFITYLMDRISPFSVDSVVRRHTRDIARLQKVADNRRALAEASVTAATDILKDAREHSAHAARADRLADRMKALLD
jgi:hypothetical protein